MINNNNQYIFINKNLWEIIGEKGKETPIKYEIDKNKLKFKLDDNIELVFNQKNNKYIIAKDNLDSKINSNIDEFYKIYDDIKNYYYFETDFLRFIRNNQEKVKQEILVSKKWFD